MKNIEMAHKEYHINLDKVLTAVKALAPEMVYGISSDSNTRIHCKDETTQEQVLAIESYLDGIAETSVEATSYRSAEQLKTAIDAMKTAMLSKQWNDMSAMERGLLMGMEPTADAMIAANKL